MAASEKKTSKGDLLRRTHSESPTAKILHLRAPVATGFVLTIRYPSRIKPKGTGRQEDTFVTDRVSMSQRRSSKAGDEMGTTYCPLPRRLLPVQQECGVLNDFDTVAWIRREHPLPFLTAKSSTERCLCFCSLLTRTCCNRNLTG